MARWNQRRRLVDRDPATPEEPWLAELAREGWVPEHQTGADTVVNGRRVVRYAMIRPADANG